MPENPPDVRQLVVVGRPVELGRLVDGEGAQQVEHHQLARHVVGAAGVPGPVPRRDAEVVRHDQVHAVDVDLQVALGHPLPVGHRLGDRVDHAEVALDDGLERLVVGRGPDAGEQVAHAGQHHVGLAERGQHLADVAQEGRVGADHQDAAALQGLAVGVQEIGGAVEGRDGLAGAGAALDDEGAVQAGADHPVLFGLDGGHDVAHAAGALAAEGGQQRGLADETAVDPAVDAVAVEVEHLVVDADDRTALGPQVAAADQRAGVGRGGGVEGPGGGGPPVDQDRLVLLVAQPDPADVEGLFEDVVDAAEAQPPRSTPLSWASLLACSWADTSRSTRAWWVPPETPLAYSAFSASAVCRRTVSSRS